MKRLTGVGTLEFLGAVPSSAPEKTPTRFVDRRRFVITACGLVAVALAPTPSEAARRWKGRVVDADTGQPLEGVVVLMSWVRYEPSFGGWAGGELAGADEAITDSDGRFSIRSRRSYTIPLVTKVSGPEIVVFKPGYGKWQFESPNDQKDLEGGKEVKILLPRLRTREERLKFFDTLSWSAFLPAEATKGLRAAVDTERRYLGLGR